MPKATTTSKFQHLKSIKRRRIKSQLIVKSTLERMATAYSNRDQSSLHRFTSRRRKGRNITKYTRTAETGLLNPSTKNHKSQNEDELNSLTREEAFINNSIIFIGKTFSPHSTTIVCVLKRTLIHQQTSGY